MSRRRIAVFLIAAATATSALAERQFAPRSHVHVRILDADTGAVTPAMVSINDTIDGKMHLPGNGRIYYGPGSSPDEFFAGIEYGDGSHENSGYAHFGTGDDMSGWHGPVRLMHGDGDNYDRGYPYGELRSVPFWEPKFAYLTTGDFTIDLIAGRYKLSVMRGTETIPVTTEFEVSPPDAQDVTVRLERWINMADRGWYSGDVHVHHPALNEGHRMFLMCYAKGADCNVVNLLEMGDSHRTEFKQAGFGKAFRRVDGNYALVAGQEEPRADYGHIIGLNINALVRDTSRYKLYDIAFDGIHKQGGLVGYAHFAWNGCSLPRGFPWYITTKKVDFIELMQFSTINRPDYYDYLNLGFRLTAAAGSDIPWGSTIGEVRTYVYTGKSFDVDDWFAGLKQGHTFVSNGPVIEATIGEHLPGSEIRIEAGQALLLKCKALSHPAVGLAKELTVTGPDGTIGQVTRDENDKSADPLSMEINLTANRSQWISIGVTCDNGALAQTTPFYIIVNDQPWWNPKRAAPIIEKQLAGIEMIRTEANKAADTPYIQQIKARLDHAEAFYRDMAKQMAATADVPELQKLIAKN